ncbi:hypothetical protein GGI21_003693, partial [Coemansia aciculifera]
MVGVLGLKFTFEGNVGKFEYLAIRESEHSVMLNAIAEWKSSYDGMKTELKNYQDHVIRNGMFIHAEDVGPLYEKDTPKLIVIFVHKTQNGKLRRAAEDYGITIDTEDKMWLAEYLVKW